MESNKIKIKVETLAKRCEVCHQGDCYDSELDYCSRCNELITAEEAFALSDEKEIVFEKEIELRYLRNIAAIALIGIIVLSLFYLAIPDVAINIIWLLVLCILIFLTIKIIPDALDYWFNK